MRTTRSIGRETTTGSTTADAVTLAVLVVALFSAGGLTSAVCDAARLAPCSGSGGRFALAIVVRMLLGLSGLLVIRRLLGGEPFAVVDRQALRALPRWLAIVGGAFAAWMAQRYLLGRDLVPEFVVDTVGSAQPQWFLIVAMVFAAPLFEEVLFRGVGSRLVDAVSGLPGLGGVSAALFWALLHGQYGWLETAWIFALGLLLAGAVRHTGSLLVAIAMHAMWNTLSLLVAVV